MLALPRQHSELCRGEASPWNLPREVCWVGSVARAQWQGGCPGAADQGHSDILHVCPVFPCKEAAAPAEVSSHAEVSAHLSSLTLPSKAESVVSLTSQCSYSSTIVHVGDKKPQPELGEPRVTW